MRRPSQGFVQLKRDVLLSSLAIRYEKIWMVPALQNNPVYLLLNAAISRVQTLRSLQRVLTWRAAWAAVRRVHLQVNTCTSLEQIPNNFQALCADSNVQQSLVLIARKLVMNDAFGRRALDEITHFTRNIVREFDL